ncbi:amylo-alpha-1,6-glucosidase [Hymenobacter bucti]|uniref:Amylo-alpha-1,6-glucosidase n=1 Tax=Hymenobacter bucti TaxID=1844114 RepID=A0ABW4QNY4_9BACT
MPDQRDILETMRIAVPRPDNRIASFTNKAAAYYCAATHAADHPEYSWFEGLNVAKNRVFGGYDLYVGDQRLDNQAAAATVYPHKLERQHGPALQEELWLFDERNLLEVDLSGAPQPVGIQLKGERVNFLRQQDDIAFFSAQEGNFVLAVAPRQPGAALTRQGERVATAGTGFFIACGQDEAEAVALVREGQQHGPALKLARQQRLRQFLQTHAYLVASNDALTLALRWLAITTDQLVARQQGDGIYAGLPWFNEYWGRDEFIALPGAVLVTGQFATARRMLVSFAQFQQTDPASKYYGRVPNIVNPSKIDYHTTDGTPRFVLALRAYVQYSGDLDLGRELYPAVRASIEGALQNWVDDRGYLLHEDNETWMDARDAHHVAYTPRGTRANDIQALWYQQLLAGAYFAAYMHDSVNQAKWTQLAEQVKQHFGQDYRQPTHDYLADRLDPQGRPDFTLRPNQLFALDLVADPAFTRQVLRKTWQALVYPWGVATLDQHDPQFHPYHLAPDYHKDAAYHRGTIWPWLNGIAIQRMLEAGQVETAYQLFANANRQALTLGVVGGLGENLDAYPRPGQAWPKLTGAYLQAWSNAEQLRVWYQYFLGIRPDVPHQHLTLAPRLPAAIQYLDYRFVLGAGAVAAQYQAGPQRTFTYTFQGVEANVEVDILPFAPTTIAVQPGTTLKVTATAQQFTLELFAQSRLVRTASVAPSATRLAQQAQDDEALADVAFARPLPLSSHPVVAAAHE